MKFQVVIVAYLFMFFNPTAAADYPLGCKDPNYIEYVENRFGQFENKNRRLFDTTFRDYELSLATSSNPYQVIASLSRHLKYSGQFDPPVEVETKIDRIFEHAGEMNLTQQIAGDAFDSFSSETHSVGIAKAWLAYRQGNPEKSFKELLKSIDITDSALLSSFGPDFEFVRQIYRDGHVAPVVEYIDKTEAFWTGQRADELRDAWRRMIKAECKIQFDSVDLIKVVELGLSVG